MVQDKEEKRITVRVSPLLYDKVALAASERNLTINAFIIQSLENSVETEPKPVLEEILRRLAMVESKLGRRD